MAALAFIALVLVSTLAPDLMSAVLASALTSAAGLAAVVETLLWVWSALITGAVAVVLAASLAKAGAAMTEAASKAAEMVFNMVVSSCKDLEAAPSRQLFDHGESLDGAR